MKMLRNRNRCELSNPTSRQIRRGDLDKMRSAAIAAALLAALVVAGSVSLAADKLRVAKVNIDKLQREYKELQAKEQELAKLRQRNAAILQLLAQYTFLPKESFDEMVAIARLPRPWPQDKQKRAEELKKISTEKEKQYLALRAKTNRSPQEEDQFKTLQELVQARNADLRQIEQQLYQEFVKRQKELQQELLAKVRAAIEKVAKEKKYDLVLDDVAVFFGGEDITDAVLAELNKGSGK